MSRWYAHVPKDPTQNRRFRRDLLVEACGSPEARAWLRDCCRDDILFYTNAFVWTYDPRLPLDKMVPFITYPIQDWALHEINGAIDKGRDLTIEKSRDMGASWMCLGVFEWRWHFQADQTFMCLSRNAESVDKFDNEDALFTKIDRIHRMTPSWLMPAGWDRRKHRNRMAFTNPETGSSINGGATVADAAVGGRRTAILIDEFSRIEEGYEIDLGTADNTNCRIFNFTAYGKDNAAYALLKNKYKKKIRLHWSADPRKNRKLYKWDGEIQRFKYYAFNDDTLELDECGPHEFGPEDADQVNFDAPGRRFEPVADGVLRSPVYDAEDTRRGSRRYMAINWDIDYEGSDDRFFDVKLLQELDREFAVAPYWEGDIEVDEATGELLAFVPAASGPLRLWCNLDREGKPPQSDKGYGAGCDISWGRGATPSCCAVADAGTGEKVLEYVTPFIPPDRFATRVVAICKAFLSKSGGNTHLAWERLGPGDVFKDKVLELNYGNVYYHGTEADKNFSDRRKPGWPPNKANSAELLGEYQAGLRNRRYVNRSTAALREAENFVETDRGIQSSRFAKTKNRLKVGAGDDQSGSRESHGDRVIMDALCFRAIKSLGLLGRVENRRATPPEEVVGTLAWRAAVHAMRDREEEENWGF